MTNEEFDCWIEGYLSLSDETYINANQINIIKNHAKLVEATVGSKNLNCLSFADALMIELNNHKVISKVNFEKLANKMLLKLRIP